MLIMDTLSGWIADQLADADPRAAIARVSTLAVEQRRIFDVCSIDGQWPAGVDPDDYSKCVQALENAVFTLRTTIAQLDAQNAATARAAAIGQGERASSVAKLRALRAKNPNALNPKGR